MQEGITSNYAEQLALTTVISPVLQTSALSNVVSNYGVTLADGSNRYIDFAIITAVSRIAIEIDGYAYHAEGAISRPRFDDQLHRQNELTLQGWTVLRFSFDQIRQTPDRCQDQLRRLILGDAELHRNFTKLKTEPTGIQADALVRLQTARDEGKTRGLVTIPTGTGKTILSALDAKAVGGRLLFIAHNNEILRQAATAYSRVIPNASIGFINSDQESGHDKDLVFANIASLRKQSCYKLFERDHFSYVVVDEFHHGAAPSYSAVLDHFKPIFMLGLTATPERTDRKDVVSLLGGNLIYSLSTREAMDKGYLVPFTYYGLHDNIDYRVIRHNGYRYDLADLEKALLIPKRDQAIVEKYQEMAFQKRAIGFCVSIKHAERMADVFNSASIPSVAIHSGLSKEERAFRVAKYERRQVDCVFVRDIFNEGVDFPDTNALLFLRPTESKIIFTQQLGRGLRISPNKENVTVLDFIGNYRGAADLPGVLNTLCSGEEDKDYRPKPELVFENGCKVYFSEEAIESFSIPSLQASSPAFYFEKIAAHSDRIDRMLMPIDLYLLLGDSFGAAVVSAGGYTALTKKMNSLNVEADIIDPAFSGLDIAEALDGNDSLDSIAETFFQLLNVLEAMSAKMAEMPGSGRISREAEVEIAWDVHDMVDEAIELIAPFCLVRNTLTALASPFRSLLTKIEPYCVESEERFFAFLATASMYNNAYPRVNFLRVGASNNWGLCKCVEASPDPSGAAIGALDMLLERRSLQWFVDLYDLTSWRSVDA